MLIICFKLDKDGATKAISSAYPNAPAYVNPTWQPRPDCFKSKNSSPMYKLNNKGEITPPCLTPFDMEKLQMFYLPILHGIIGSYTCNIIG